MLTTTIESPFVEQSSTATTTTIYGLIPRPEDGINDIKLLWNRRTAASYQRIFLENINITDTLWRDAKSGTILKWMPQMLSDIGKKEGVVIENYLNMDILPSFTQQRLALEQMGMCCTQIIKSYHALQKNGYSDSQKQNLIRYVGELNNEINYYPGLLDLENNLEDILEIMPKIREWAGENKVFDDFTNTFEQARFEKLDVLVRSSQWTDNCLQIQEIYQKRLFRFRYGSFDEYCKSSKLSQGMRRVKIGEVIRQIQNTGLPLPNNRGQAYTLSEIPNDNRLSIWQATLDSSQKISARLILQIHSKSLGATEPELKYDPAPILGRIEVLLAKSSTLLPESTASFLDHIKKMNFCSLLEIKMLRSISAYLQESLKSAQLLETTQKL